MVLFYITAYFVYSCVAAVPARRAPPRRATYRIPILPSLNVNRIPMPGRRFRPFLDAKRLPN
jgi:hypothetical protein